MFSSLLQAYMAILSGTMVVVAMLSISVFFFSFPAMVLAEFSQIRLPTTDFGPESLAFEIPGGAFYTGVNDGHILRYNPLFRNFTVFAITSPNRSVSLCDGTMDPDKGPICGRPLGLAYNFATRMLYIADAYYGLLVADANGRLARPIATSAEGQTFVSCNAIDIDPLTKIIYFTDASAVYDLRNASKAAQANDSTGRLMKYDPRTNQVTVLLRNLSVAVGVAVSIDSSFVLVSEFVGNRITRYWLTGPKANTAEVFFDPINVVRPNNIKRNPLGNFWVAAASVRLGSQTLAPIGLLIDSNGSILRRVELQVEYGSTLVSEVQESGAGLYVSSRGVGYVGLYTP